MISFLEFWIVTLSFLANVQNSSRIYFKNPKTNVQKIFMLVQQVFDKYCGYL